MTCAEECSGPYNRATGDSSIRTHGVLLSNQAAMQAKTRRPIEGISSDKSVLVCERIGAQATGPGTGSACREGEIHGAGARFWSRPAVGREGFDGRAAAGRAGEIIRCS